MSIFRKVALSASLALGFGVAQAECTVGAELGKLVVGAETFPIEVPNRYEYASTEAIAVFLKQAHDRLNPAFGATGGTYATRLKLEKFYVGRLPSGQKCVYVAHVEFKVGIVNPRVMIADVLKDFPCMRDHVLEHEYEHVALHQDQLRRTLKPISEGMYRYLHYARHIAIPNGKDPEKYVKDFLSEMTHELVKDFRKTTVTREHAAIDGAITQHSHRTACDGQVTQITAALAAR